MQLVVAPAGGGYPSLTLQKDLIAYFDDKRMLTTQIRVKDPAYVDIVIVGQLTVMPQYFNDQVQNNAVQACHNYGHSTTSISAPRCFSARSTR